MPEQIRTKFITAVGTYRNIVIDSFIPTLCACKYIRTRVPTGAAVPLHLPSL
eukprot:SAG31_NODE_29845_length_389_cov_0.600000_1_plen_51_part_01